ncbi:transmembrane protein 104 homolog isoform X3 [Prorops nasuta]|uniref:transmembrane protein 104 homolog isoform X3 n=1 Tax=Prorops nasuta TaxID=863751 RepID=UPI0034CECE4B
MPEEITTDQYSRWMGLIYIFNLIVGTGALTLPAVFSLAGWGLGIAVILLLAIISFITATFVIEAMASANAIVTWRDIQHKKRVMQVIGESEPSNSDSEETPLVAQITDTPNPTDSNYRYYIIHNKIEMGQMTSILFSKFGNTLFYLCLVIYLYGDLSIYGAAVAKSIVDIACTYQPANTTCNDSIPVTEPCAEGSIFNRFNAYRMFLTNFIILVVPFVLYNVQKTKYLQLLTSAVRWFAFSIMIIYATRKIILYGPQGDPPVASISGIPTLFGACVYSFMCHHSLPALIAPIANKSSLNRSLALDYLLIASFYLLLAVTGAFAFRHLDDLYTLDFGPRSSGDCSTSSNVFLIFIEYFLALFPVFTLSTNFPIIAITLRNNLQTLLFKDDSLNHSRIKKFICVCLAVIPPYLVAMTTMDVSKLVSITGSYAGVGIQYLIPTFLVYYARKETNKTIGLGVVNNFASPFSSTIWLVLVIAWAIACMILATVHLMQLHFLSGSSAYIDELQSALSRNAQIFNIRQ